MGDLLFGNSVISVLTHITLFVAIILAIGKYDHENLHSKRSESKLD